MEDIVIIAPDGTEVVFPAGTPDSVIEAAMKVEYGGAESADLYGDASLMGAIESAPAQEAYRGQSGNPIDISEWDAASLVQLPQGAWVVHRKYNNGEPFQLAAAPEAGAGGFASENLGNVAVNPPQRWDQDFVRSIPTGIAEGVTGLVGAPRGIVEGTHAGLEWLRGKVGIEGEGPNIPVVSDVTQFLQGLPGEVTSRFYPTQQDADRAVQNVIGDYYQPQGTAGEYGRTIGQFAGGAVVPGSAATRVASVVVPAVASETAGQLTDGTPAEPAARLAGALVGGLGVGGVSSMRNGVGRVVQNATEGVTPQQLQLAEALRGRASQVGVPLTNAEALQQVTGGATGLSRVQRVVEGANQRIPQMMALRPQQTQTAIARVLDQVAPETQGSQVATRAQEGANQVLNTLRQRVNESAQPFYDRLPGQTLAPDVFAQLEANPSYMAAQREVMGDPELAALLTGAPDDLSTVMLVKQQLDTMAENARPGAMNPQGNNTRAAVRDDAAALARALGGEASPDFRMALETGATGRQAFVDPVRSGPIGRIANQNEVTPNLQGQTSALFPAAPYEGQAAETAQALRLLSEVDPSISPSLVRQHLAQQAAEATQDLSGGANQFGGANFAARVFGNPQQRETIMGAVDVAAPQASRDVRDLVEVLAATGQRERAGSNTTFNNELTQALREGNLAQGAASVAANPPSFFGRLARGLDERVARGNNERLAEILLGDPRAFSEIVMKSAKAPRGTNRLRLLASAVASQQGNQ